MNSVATATSGSGLPNLCVGSPIAATRVKVRTVPFRGQGHNCWELLGCPRLLCLPEHVLSVLLALRASCNWCAHPGATMPHAT